MLWLLAVAGSAQPADELLISMRRAWQDQSSVFLKRNTTYRIERTEKGFTARRETEEQELMLKDQTGTAQEEVIRYSGLIPLERLEAYTLVPNGGKRKRVPVRSVSHRDEREDHIFHDDSRIASFVMPSLVSGAIAHIEHTIAYPDARFVAGHFFASYRPTVESTLTVVSDPGIEVDVRTFHLRDSLVIKSDRIEKGKRVQRFTMKQVPALHYDVNAPSARYYAPHAQLVVRLPGSDAKRSDLDRLYDWYSGHIKDTWGAPARELQALSDSIATGASTDREKAARIYRWIQDRIHYVAIEDGMNGLVPAPAIDVCRTRYGDCKGMSNLMHTLLRAQGLDSHLAWVGTREIPYRYTDLPTGANDNHMIVALRLQDTTLFLDGTAASNAFGVPSGFIQGKQTLVAMTKDSYEVMRVPVMPSSFSSVTDSVRVRLEGEGLVGKGVIRFTGYERYTMAHRLRQVPPGKQNEALRGTLTKGSNKFQLDSSEVLGLDDPDAPLTIRYHFRVPDHAHVANGKRYVPLTLSDPWKHLRFRNDRTLPVSLEHCISHRNVVILDLPAGARCSGVPSKDGAAHEAFRYDVELLREGDAVISTSSFSIDALMLEAELPAWRSANSGLLKELGRTIVIETP
ncbi:MAG: transglutaminase domain-containing protein [Flavobacteriales bacterium]|nr:transglutaminase domain-containing protein [Flavobacteriales bacterium]